MIALKKYRADWEYKRLQFGASILNSNVDKKIIEGELPVKLCNYVDVYYNDIISEKLDFMEGSATEDEIEKFKMLAGDVIITKDSESADDIGIPAYVERDLENVVCGYHLAIFKPFKDELNGKFLLYFLNSKVAQTNFELGANGVTRFGLGRNAIKTLPVPYPKLEEQTLIARFLDQKTSQIDQLIEQKEKLLKLLAEKRTAIITQAVTKGLDPDVEMKDSEVDWLGEIPKHWIPKRLKYLTDKIIDGTHSTPEYLSEGVPFLRVTDIVKSNGEKLDSDNFKYISEEEHQELTKRCNPEKGDLLYSKNGTIGIPRVIDWDFDFSIFVSLCLVKIKRDLLIPSFLSYSLQSKLTENQISIGSKKSAVINLHLDKIKEFVIPYPPMDEQIKINDWLNKQLPKFNKSEKKLIKSIDRLKEYREALITSAVTGQIDVRKEVSDE